MEHNKLKIAFFGTPEYSLLVLNALFEAGFTIVCAVTKPPLPMGRKQIPTPTAVADWASAKQISFLTPQSDPRKPWLFADELAVTKQILEFKPDILITADYTQKIPISLIRQIRFGGLNVHPSLLPAYRGPAPVPWALLNGEKDTGISIVTLSEKFDQGKIIAQEKEPILPTDTTDTLLTKLFTKGGQLLVEVSPKYIYETYNPSSPPLTLGGGIPHLSVKERQGELSSRGSYFPRMTRDTGYVPWKLVKMAMEGKTIDFATMKQLNNVTLVRTIVNKHQSDSPQSPAIIIERAFRALHPWPGIWTKITVNDEPKRLKFLNVSIQGEKLVLDSIQVEGKSSLAQNEAFHWLNVMKLL